jgi:hypothetical protein
VVSTSSNKDSDEILKLELSVKAEVTARSAVAAFASTRRVILDTQSSAATTHNASAGIRT